MMFVKLTDGQPSQYPYTLGDLRRDNPNISFPTDIPVETLKAYSVYKVKQTPAPEIDTKTHRYSQTISQINEEWVQIWSETELPLGQASENIRKYRDYLLSSTDWIVAVSYERGETVPVAWATYRQALRDITAQPGFPHDVVWPEKP